MPKKIDLSEIAKKNPHVNLEELEEGRKLRQNLRQAGTERRRGTLPNNRRRVRIDDDVSSDPRVVRLQRSLREIGKRNKTFDVSG